MENNNVIVADNKNSKEYQKPELVDLNALKESQGVCSAGSGDGTYCSAGNAASVGYCAAGINPGTYCTAGTSAVTACTDGSAAATCTIGSGDT